MSSNSAWATRAAVSSMLLPIALACRGGVRLEDAVLSCKPVAAPINWDLGALSGESPAVTRGAFPSALRPIADTVLFASTPDLNCDGRDDLVAQIVGAAGSPFPGQLMFIAYLNAPTGWNDVLSVPSRVDGREVLALAAPLSGKPRLDLVTLGMDDGGSSPRVFRWTDSTYAEVLVPKEYSVRFEEDWPSQCRQRAVPRFVSGARLSMLRETISRSSPAGHGSDCALPLDTLALSGDSLIPAAEER